MRNIIEKAAESGQFEWLQHAIEASGDLLYDWDLASDTITWIGTGRAMAEQWGVPAYRFLLMPHPIANLTEAELDQRAREMAPQVVKLLLQGQD